MVTDNILVVIFLSGIAVAIASLTSGTFHRKMTDFQITHTSVQTFLNLSEFECSAKCLRADLCQAAIVIRRREEERFQICGLLLYEDDSNSTNGYTLDLQDLDGISAIWFKSRTPEATEEKDSQTTTTVTCEVPFHIYKSGCYFVTNQLLTWQEAENHCQRFGNNAHLVRPDTVEKLSEIGTLTSLPIWIGANDTNGDNVIRYLGDGGAIIPDDSPLWRIPLKHRFEKIDNDCVLGDIFSLSPCHWKKDFVCEAYF